ncbi:MAG: transglycosylase domain-containing protein [Acidimicrobiia bacterium]
MRGLVKYVIAVGLAGLGTASAVAAAAPQVEAIFTAHRSTSSLPELSTLAERSVMYDVNGNQIQIFTAAENRKPVAIDEVSQGVIDAVLATEDEGFYRHEGVNLRSLLRATLANVSAGGVVQGGSTITQQVVKLGLVGSKRDADRKIREAMYALRLEKQLTKSEILERYLNSVYFGNGAYGVKAAAEVYFGKDVKDLGLKEGAFLAGLIRNPNGYDPFRYPQRFMTRRRFVLDRLVDLGKMTRADADAIAAEQPPIRSFATPERQPAPTYFVARAKQALLKDPSMLGDTDLDRYNALFTGGLRIYTTFDPHLQQLAEQARTDLMPDTGGQFEAALASVDPRTGAVKALVGGPGFDVLNFDLSTQGRNQAGSSFKTFVLVAALEGGARPGDVIDGNAGCSFTIPGQKEPYTPSGHGAGVGTIEKMFASSINCAFVRMGLIVHPERVVETAERMGIPKGILQPYASIALGTFGVSPLNMASSYGTLAAEGVRHDPYYIERIEDRKGNVIYQHEARGQQVVDRDIALTAQKIMQGVVTGGTGKKARIDGREVAGKTGTTNNSADVWFVGYTPQLSTAVWIGSRYGDSETVKLNGKVQFGGDLPAQIWQRFTSTALEGVDPTPFNTPAPYSKSRGPARLVLPSDECWAKAATADPAADPAAPPAPAVDTNLDYSDKVPPTLMPTPLDPRLAPIPLVPVAGYTVQPCRVVIAAFKAAEEAAKTSTTVAETTSVPATTTPSTSSTLAPIAAATTVAAAAVPTTTSG